MTSSCVPVKAARLDVGGALATDHHMQCLGQASVTCNGSRGNADLEIILSSDQLDLPSSLTFALCLSFAGPLTHIDDEYSNAGIEDPRVLITTSRDPSSKLAQFAKVRQSLSLPLFATANSTLLDLLRKCDSVSPTRPESTEETTS